MKKVYIYKAFERFWHWAQALIIFFLAFTGFEIHGSFEFLGFETAVRTHNYAAYAFMVLIAFAIFWHFTTGEWKQYIPTLTNLKAQAEFYIFGIFKNEEHPMRKTLLTKLNPLQRLVYLFLKIIIIPGMVISGMLYLFYRYARVDGSIETLALDNLGGVAYVHTIGAFMLVAFIIAHLYLMTTGTSLWSNLQAMITGFEELEEDEEEEETLN